MASAELDAASAERSAVASLGLQDGDCIASAHVMRPKVDAREIDRTLPSGSGWVNGVFVGTSDDLLSARLGRFVLLSSGSVWVAFEAEGRTVVDEFRSLPLPSGRMAWILDSSMQSSVCD